MTNEERFYEIFTAEDMEPIEDGDIRCYYHDMHLRKTTLTEEVAKAVIAESENWDVFKKTKCDWETTLYESGHYESKEEPFSEETKEDLYILVKGGRFAGFLMLYSTEGGTFRLVSSSDDFDAGELFVPEFDPSGSGGHWSCSGREYRDYYTWYFYFRHKDAKKQEEIEKERKRIEQAYKDAEVKKEELKKELETKYMYGRGVEAQQRLEEFLKDARTEKLQKKAADIRKMSRRIDASIDEAKAWPRTWDTAAEPCQYFTKRGLIEFFARVIASDPDNILLQCAVAGTFICEEMPKPDCKYGEVKYYEPILYDVMELLTKPAMPPELLDVFMFLSPFVAGRKTDTPAADKTVCESFANDMLDFFEKAGALLIETCEMGNKGKAACEKLLSKQRDYLSYTGYWSTKKRNFTK